MTARVECRALTVTELAKRWGELRGWIDAACTKDIEQKITSVGLYDECMAGSSVAVEIYWHGIPCGCGILSGTNIKNGRHLFVQALGGMHMDKWLPEFVEFLDSMARATGSVDGVLFVGRPGWKKVLVGLGFETVLVTMRKEVRK